MHVESGSRHVKVQHAVKSRLKLTAAKIVRQKYGLLPSGQWTVKSHVVCGVFIFKIEVTT